MKLTEQEIITLRRATGADFSRPFGDTINFARAIEAEVLRLNGGGGEAWSSKAMELATDFAVDSLRVGSYERIDIIHGNGVASYKTIDLRKKREESRERLRQHLYAPQPQQEPGKVEPAEYKCGHCGYIGRGRTNGFSAPWCSKCQRNDRLERVKSPATAAPGAVLEGWQPIETAPKDGTSVLIYCPKNDRKQVSEVWWAIPYEGATQGYWSTPVGATGRGYTILETSPTHWMPLPPAPSAPKPQGDIQEQHDKIMGKQ